MALANGYGLIDTAAAYFNERQVGEGIRRSGADRAEVLMTTKLWISDYGYDETRRAFDASLQRLGVEYVDLHLLHWPMPNEWKRTVASYRAAETLLAEGRVRVIGVANLGARYLDQLIARAQVVLRWHVEHGLSTIPRSVCPAPETVDTQFFAIPVEEVYAEGTAR